MRYVRTASRVALASLAAAFFIACEKAAAPIGAGEAPIPGSSGTQKASGAASAAGSVEDCPAPVGGYAVVPTGHAPTGHVGTGYAAATPAEAGPVERSRVLSKNFVNGRSPAGDADFAAIAKAGVKVVVSVDGARPFVETAAKHGLRYVHVPIGYEGIPDEQIATLSKAFTTLEGPFYVHCHHGKHRGPAACAVGRMLVDGASVDQVVAEMQRAGTDPRYRGLYAVARNFTRPSAERLAAVKDLPSVAPVPAFALAMVEADDKWDRLQAVRAAGWKSPPAHPDVQPAHEAVILAEWFREMARREEVAKRPGAFAAGLKETEDAAWALSKALEANDPDASEKAFQRVRASCASCHSGFRDNAKRQ